VETSPQAGERAVPGRGAAWQPVVACPLQSAPARVEAVATEEPLEIRVRGAAFAVLLRTPGRERDLIAGFLASEGILQSPDDLRAIEPCPPSAGGLPEDAAWNVALAEGVRCEPERARGGVVGSSCGMCGTRMLADLQRALPRRPGPPAPLPPLAELQRAFAELRRRQPTFQLTAGTHGAGLAEIEPGGGLRLLDAAEDVGRHNAADKLLGAQLRAGNWPLARPMLLLVSGRVSYEIVHKCALAGAAAVAGVGMPTSLAVRAARSAGLRLLGFVRDGGGLSYAPEPAPD